MGELSHMVIRHHSVPELPRREGISRIGTPASEEAVTAHLLEVREDIVENVELFFASKEGEQPSPLGLPIPIPDMAELPFRRYKSTS